ncbi:hypothetical protein [Novosphingobium sp. PhB165]|nr:hypothetical protein [Novosphingobium sp. PhB165]
MDGRQCLAAGIQAFEHIPECRRYFLKFAEPLCLRKHDECCRPELIGNYA